MEEKYKTLRNLLGDGGFWKAQNRYNDRFDNAIYTAATAGKSTKYANALIDEALALCGSPYHKLSHRRWSAEAVRFLEQFIMPDN